MMVKGILSQAKDQVESLDLDFSDHFEVPSRARHMSIAQNFGSLNSKKQITLPKGGSSVSSNMANHRAFNSSASVCRCQCRRTTTTTALQLSVHVWGRSNCSGPLSCG